MRSIWNACRKGWCVNTKGKNSITPGARLSVALFMLATVLIVILAAFPQLRPGFDAGNPMNTRDIIIICMLAAACLMVVLCKTSTDAIVLTSTFRAGMSSLAVILGIVTLGTTFIDAHLAEIKDIAGNILQAYPMLLALVLFGHLRAALFTGSHHAVDYPACRRTWRSHLGYSGFLCGCDRRICSTNVPDLTGSYGVRHHRDNARR